MTDNILQKLLFKVLRGEKKKKKKLKQFWWIQKFGTKSILAALKESINTL